MFVEHVAKYASREIWEKERSLKKVQAEEHAEKDDVISEVSDLPRESEDLDDFDIDDL